MKLDQRGAAPVVGFALIVFLVVVLSTSIVYVSSDTLVNSQSTARGDGAEHSLTKFDSRVSLTALSYDKEKTEYDFGSIMTSNTHFEENGWLRLRIINRSGGTKRVLVNETFTNIVYENERSDKEVVYQGGGVWKKSRSGGTTIISTPEFAFRGRTITLPVVKIDNTSEFDRRVKVEKKSTKQLYPNRSANLDNPLDNGTVNVTIQSEFYKSWAEFFRERTEAQVTTEDSRNITHATLRIPLSYTVKNGLATKASGQTLEFSNRMSVDAYNSSKGPYSSSQSRNASIVIESDLDLGNNVNVTAEVQTGGEIFIRNSAEINGDVICPNPDTCVQPTSNEDQISGTITRGDVNVEAPPAGPYIDRKKDTISDPSENENGAAADISSNSFDDDGDGTLTLTSGEYYLEGDVVLSNSDSQPDDMVLDTTGGNISIMVDGDFELKKQDIEIQGDNRVNIYVDDKNVSVRQTEMTTGGEDSTQLFMFARSGTDATFSGGNTKYVGVFYAPSTQSSITEVTLEQKANIYGGIVGYTKSVGNQVEVHYDEALIGEGAFPEQSGITYVTYVHISVNEVEISPR